MIIYAYTLTCYPSLIKIGQTARNAEQRIKEQVRILPIVNGIKPYKILYELDDKTLNVNITDREIHKALKQYHVSGEWFNCSIKVLDNTIKKIAKKKLASGQVYLTSSELKFIKTKRQQHKKVYKTKTLTYNNQTMTYGEWGKVTGLGTSLIHNRVKRGWSVEKTLTTPARNKRSYI